MQYVRTCINLTSIILIDLILIVYFVSHTLLPHNHFLINELNAPPPGVSGFYWNNSDSLTLWKVGIARRGRKSRCVHACVRASVRPCVCY
jgi:hypothetical protein